MICWIVLKENLLYYLDFLSFCFVDLIGFNLIVTGFLTILAFIDGTRHGVHFIDSLLIAVSCVCLIALWVCSPSRSGVIRIISRGVMNWCGCGCFSCCTCCCPTKPEPFSIPSISEEDEARTWPTFQNGKIWQLESSQIPRGHMGLCVILARKSCFSYRIRLLPQGHYRPAQLTVNRFRLSYPSTIICQSRNGRQGNDYYYFLKSADQGYYRHVVNSKLNPAHVTDVTRVEGYKHYTPVSTNKWAHRVWFLRLQLCYFVYFVAHAAFFLYRVLHSDSYYSKTCSWGDIRDCLLIMSTVSLVLDLSTVFLVFLRSFHFSASHQITKISARIVLHNNDEGGEGQGEYKGGGSGETDTGVDHPHGLSSDAAINRNEVLEWFTWSYNSDTDYEPIVMPMLHPVMANNPHRRVTVTLDVTVKLLTMSGYEAVLSGVPEWERLRVDLVKGLDRLTQDVMWPSADQFDEEGHPAYGTGYNNNNSNNKSSCSAGGTGGVTLRGIPASVFCEESCFRAEDPSGTEALFDYFKVSFESERWLNVYAAAKRGASDGERSKWLRRATFVRDRGADDTSLVTMAGWKAGRPVTVAFRDSINDVAMELAGEVDSPRMLRMLSPEAAHASRDDHRAQSFVTYFDTRLDPSIVESRQGLELNACYVNERVAKRAMGYAS